MKKMLIALAATGLLAAGFNAPAFADEATFKSAGCAKCHDPDKKKKGAPSIKDMTAKYKGDKAQVAKLLSVIKGKDHPEVEAKDDDIKKGTAFAIGAK
ncbi:MAG TPA: cytochrome C [Usitatibacteraceae bacterium]|nr:cytochrome C [Usitatibacteraceae bacterium]